MIKQQRTEGSLEWSSKPSGIYVHILVSLFSHEHARYGAQCNKHEWSGVNEDVWCLWVVSMVLVSRKWPNNALLWKKRLASAQNVLRDRLKNTISWLWWWPHSLSTIVHQQDPCGRKKGALTGGIILSVKLSLLVTGMIILCHKQLLCVWRALIHHRKSWYWYEESHPCGKGSYLDSLVLGN